MPWDHLLDESERRRVVSRSDVTLDVLQWRGDDDLVLLAHAAGFHKELWLPTIEELRRRGATATVAALDLRGHGQSIEPPGGLCWWDFARDVLAVHDASSAPGRVIGAGHSTGGAAVAGGEILEPGSFAALVLVDPAIMPPDHLEQDGGVDNPWAQSARRRRARFASRAEALSNFSSKPVFATWPQEVLELYVAHGMRDDGDGVTLRCRPAFEADVFSRPEMVELWEHLPRIEADVTVVTSEHSATHPIEHATATATHARADHVRVAGVSHFIPMEAPAAVADAILGHLR